MEQEQKDVIQDIYNTLESVSKDERTEYKHRFKEGRNEWTETVNREENLQAIIEWAMQQIENNFDFEEEKRKMNKKIETVNINDLKVDYSYRSSDNPSADGIVENFERLAIGYITVSVREDGLYIIDGIRRIEALKQLGYVECPAEMLYGLTVEDEARIFVNMNKFHDEYDEEFEVYPDVEVE
ncbi:type II toxin-antitoxin system antitoxin TscA [Staphylococcus capitis]|uniref:type II toxin-antitoxin system antitoxin TscA n=1 Tax=Staphylococcus capitis TaxID=29388 RepID=UPI003C12BC7F